MSVELDPQELGFKRPFTTEVSQTLRLMNPHSDPVIFKVKTTAPKQYCVRPNSGRIEARDAVEVQVLLQAMREDPAPDTKCKDKFLVQSVAVNADKDSNVATVWQNVDLHRKSDVQERKIRVNFLSADGNAPLTPAKRQVNGVSPVDTTPSQQTPSMAAFTPTNGTSADTPASRQTVGEAITTAAADAAQTVRSTAQSAVNAVPTTQEELKQQLSAAQAQIEQLRKQLTDSASGLRQRNVGSGSTAGGKSENPVVQQLQHAPDGVPVQVVAVLCLMSFILAYLLF